MTEAELVARISLGEDSRTRFKAMTYLGSSVDIDSYDGNLFKVVVHRPD
ncbi:MAG: hypothetical protein ABIJ86_09900 [Spirochaetota bacterium]